MQNHLSTIVPPCSLTVLKKVQNANRNIYFHYVQQIKKSNLIDVGTNNSQRWRLPNAVENPKKFVATRSSWHPFNNEMENIPYFFFLGKNTDYSFANCKFTTDSFEDGDDLASCLSEDSKQTIASSFRASCLIYLKLPITSRFCS